MIRLYLSSLILILALRPGQAEQLPPTIVANPQFVDTARVLEVQTNYVFSFEGTAAGQKWLAKQLKTNPNPRLLAIAAQKRLDDPAHTDPELREADWEVIRRLSLEGDAFAQVTLARSYLETAHEQPLGLRPFRYMDAVRLLEPLRNSQYAEANSLYSYMHIYGLGVPQDLDQAWTYSQAALWHGEPIAASNLAKYWLSDTPSGIRDRARGLDALYGAAREGSSYARNKLESMQSDGDADATRLLALATLWRHSLGADYVTPKVKKAQKLAEQLAPADAEAAFILAYHGFSRGAGTKAAKATYAWAQKAAELGNDNGHVMVARLQAEGHGTEKQPTLAIATLRTYAAKDNPLALGLLGYYSYWGELHKHGMKKDKSAAYAYCSRAAAMGDIISVINTAFCFEEGIGVPKDYQQALFYRDWAARRGHVESQNLIPGLYAASR